MYIFLLNGQNRKKVLILFCFVSDIIEKDVGGLEKDRKDPGDEKKVSENKDGSEEDKQAEEKEKNLEIPMLKENFAAEDSGTEVEEYVAKHVPHPSTPNFESALEHPVHSDLKICSDKRIANQPKFDSVS